MTELKLVPQENFTKALDSGPAHFGPLFLACRDFGCAFGMVGQNAGVFEIPKPHERPTIVMLGDDFDQAFGPAAFHAGSLRKLAQLSKSAVIVACGPELSAYAAAASNAVVLREHVVIVETRPEFELAWMHALLSANPKIKILLATVPRGAERAQ